ncbi:MAG: AAA family ATPase [Gaiellaceae bacterium]
MPSCPRCSAENPPGQKFCGDCGALLAARCPACGTQNGPGQNFCGECGASLAAPTTAAAATPAAERRLVSVLFADLVGFTAWSQARDAEEVRELLSRYFDGCKRLISLYGGTVEKFIGDAVMAVWGTPVATEDDAERAVRAALDLVAAVSALGDELGAPDLRARAAVMTGEAAVTLGAEGQGMVAGDLVNTASRVQSLAEPRTVLVGEATRRASERAIAYEDAGAHELKGKEGQTSVWRALRVVSARGGELRSEGLEAPFVGRERDLRRIKELFHSCAEERKAHLVSVTGVAGIGKSRLGWEFYKYFDGIVERVWWHRGRCLAYGDGVTYWALADMVRMRCRISEDETPEAASAKLRSTLEEHLLDVDERRFVEPRLARLLGLGDWEGGDRQELFAAWRLFFERLAESQTVLLMFEDLQWADASLLDFVEYLLEWSRNHPIFVVTLARPELLERRASWGAGQRNFSSTYLEPLPEEAMRELLVGLVPGLPPELEQRILDHAEGVPLYAVETVRMLLDRGLLEADGAVYRLTGPVEELETPETLHALIAARLDGLSEQERRLLQDGAVLGKTFTRSSLAALSEVDEAELDGLLAGLVRKEVLLVQADARSPEHGQYGFLQDLVRRVAYDTLSKRERAGRHLAAADQIVAALGEDEAAEVVASHVLDAYRELPDDALKARAAEALVRAGEHAASLAAAGEAQHYFEQAAELTDDPLVQADLVGRAGQMAWRAHKPEEARTLLERAHAVFIDDRGDVRAAARLAAVLGEIDFVEGNPQAAAARLIPALEALETGEPDADVAAVAAALGRFLALSGEYDDALPHLERALALAEHNQLTETLSQALNTKAVTLLRRNRFHEAHLLQEGALELALAHDHHAAALRAYNNLISFSWTTGRMHATLTLVERALEHARRVGERGSEAQLVATSVSAYADLGRWDEALAKAAEAEKIATTEFAKSFILGAIPIFCERGAPEEARAMMTRLDVVARSKNPDHIGWWAITEAQVLRAEGRFEEALAAADRGLAVTAETGAGPRAEGMLEALETAARIGETELRARLAQLDELSPTEQTPFLRGQRARFQARLTPDEADSLYRTAVGLIGEAELPFHLAVAQLEYAEWLAAQGRADEGEPLLTEAAATFDPLAATPWIERAAAARSRELVRV